MKQVWHRYEHWEDYKAGMWRKVTNEDELLKVAIEFTGDHIRYGAAMLRAIVEWPISAENNLTDQNINQRAWVGHAGACIEMNLPEYIVRQAWGMLTKQQQDLANMAADAAIAAWQRNYTQGDEDNGQMQLKFES